MSGLFICFEGIDASGKATQSRMASVALNASLYSFPEYKTPSGKLIKAHLQKKWATSAYDSPDVDAMAFQALMLMNRMEFAHEITQHLQCNGNVVADRYAASGIVYGGADGLDVGYLRQVHSYLPQPDIYFLLDIPVEESFKRRPDRGGDRYEEDRAKLEEVAQRYRSLFQEERAKGGAWYALDGVLPPDEIHEQVMHLIRQHQG